MVALRDLVFASTSTIGVRVTDVTRWALDRGWTDVDVAGQRVGIKVAHRQGRIVNAAAEFRDVEAARRGLRLPVREVLDAAEAAAAAEGLARGARVPEGLRRDAVRSCRRHHCTQGLGPSRAADWSYTAVMIFRLSSASAGPIEKGVPARTCR